MKIALRRSGFIVIVMACSCAFASCGSSSTAASTGSGAVTAMDTARSTLTAQAAPTAGADPVTRSAPLTAAAEHAVWTTYHGDVQRSGVDHSTTGTATGLGSGWASADLGADVYGEPLVDRGVVYVATEGDRVDALSEATGTTVWSRSLGSPVPASQLPCGDITPTVGITSTPVIDAAKREIFVVGDVEVKGTAQHQLIGLSTKTGKVMSRQVVDPKGSHPLNQLQRPALGLDDGRVLIGYGGNSGDCAQYWGYLESVPESGSGAAFVWKVPTPRAGAIWAPGGQSIDASGHVYAATGNTFGAPSYDHSDTLEQFNAKIAQTGWYQTPNWQQENAQDQDLSSVTTAILPGGYVYQGGKNGMGYLISTAAMAKHHMAAASMSVCNSFGADVVSGSTIYVACSDGIREVRVNTKATKLSVAWHGPGDANGSPVLAGGLVWVTGYLDGVLYGLRPSSGAIVVKQTAGSMDHFVSPTPADGRILVAADHVVHSWPMTGTSPAG